MHYLLHPTQSLCELCKPSRFCAWKAAGSPHPRRCPIADNEQRFPRLRKRGRREVIISRYQEDVAWVNNIPSAIDEITIYNKGAAIPISFDDRVRVVSLPNVGREAHTWLWHWVVNRDSLADLTFTVQAGAHEHAPDLLKLLSCYFEQPSSITRHYRAEWPTKEVTQLDAVVHIHGCEIRYGDISRFETLSVNRNQSWFKSTWAWLFDCPAPACYYYGYGAMWAVPSHTILARESQYWAALLELLTTAGNPRTRQYPLDAWAMEAMWAALYTSPKVFPSRVFWT